MSKRPKTMIAVTLALIAAIVFGVKEVVFDNLLSYEHNAAIVFPGGYISTVTFTGELRGEPFSVEAKIRCHRVFRTNVVTGGLIWERHTGTVGFQIGPDDGLIVGLPSVCPCAFQKGTCEESKRNFRTDDLLAAWVDDVREIGAFELVAFKSGYSRGIVGGPGIPIRSLSASVQDGKDIHPAGWFSDNGITTRNVGYEIGPFREFQYPKFKTMMSRTRVLLCGSVSSRRFDEVSRFPTLLNTINELDGDSALVNIDSIDGTINDRKRIQHLLSRGLLHGLTHKGGKSFSFDERMDGRLRCAFVFEGTLKEY